MNEYPQLYKKKRLMKFKKDVGAQASANLIGKAQQIRIMGI